MTYYFKHTICFQELNDTEVEADFSADADDGTVSLEGCQLGGLTLTTEQIIAIMGSAEAMKQEEAAQDWWLSEGWAEAAQDEADGYGDYRYEMSREAAE